MWCFVSLKRSSRYVIFDLLSQPIMWFGQVVLTLFANEETKFEQDSADLL